MLQEKLSRRVDVHAACNTQHAKGARAEAHHTLRLHARPGREAAPQCHAFALGDSIRLHELCEELPGISRHSVPVSTKSVKHLASVLSLKLGAPFCHGTCMPWHQPEPWRTVCALPHVTAEHIKPSGHDSSSSALSSSQALCGASCLRACASTCGMSRRPLFLSYAPSTLRRSKDKK